MKNLFLFLLIVVALASCEHKDYVDPITGTPAFSVGGLRNGQAFTLAAGENGLIQTTNVERNKYGVLEWTSSFVQAGCDTCEAAFKLTINDVEGMTYENSPNSTILDASELAFAFAPSDSGFTNCSFDLVDPVGDNDLEDIDFHINGGPQINAFPVTLDPGINIIDADFSLEDNTNSPQYTIKQTVLAGSHHKLAAPFRFRFTQGNNGQPDHLHLYEPLPQPGGLRAESWETSDDNFNSVNGSFTLADEGFIRLNFYNNEINLYGFYEISWTTEPEIFEYDEEEDNFNMIITAPAIQTTWETGEHNHGKIFIDYRYNGKHYTSVNPAQSATLSIVENQPYSGTDTTGPNVKLQTSFSVTLYEVGNPQNTLELTNCRGTFGFSAPE
ncbi:MAG: hypothetical protein ACK478_02145 [Flavobacteriales bacterium]|jgi:hypothetical protein